MSSKQLAPVKTDMVRRRTYVARLSLTPKEEAALNQQGHTARALWNLLHEWYTWRGTGGSIAQRPAWSEIDRQLRDARTNPVPGYEWLALLPAQATQQVLKQYRRAWHRFFQGL